MQAWANEFRGMRMVFWLVQTGNELDMLVRAIQEREDIADRFLAG
jgi:hypothetical protein